jgi:hypothetical protein
MVPTGFAVNVDGDDAVAAPGCLVERPLEDVLAGGVHVQPHQYAAADAFPRHAIASFLPQSATSSGQLENQQE